MAKRFLKGQEMRGDESFVDLYPRDWLHRIDMILCERFGWTPMQLDEVKREDPEAIASYLDWIGLEKEAEREMREERNRGR